MDAYLSGECGRALLVQGNEAFILDIDALDEPLSVPIGFAFNAFGNANDTIELKGTSREVVLKRLNEEWARDRALRLSLILLDDEEYIEIKEAAASVLVELLEKANALGYVKRRLYARPLPHRADIQTALSIVNPSSSVGSFMNALAIAQPTIAQYRAAWDELAPELFADSDARERIEAYLIDSGAFSALVDSSGDPSLTNDVLFNCYRDLNKEKNYREIVTTWTKDAPRKQRARAEKIITVTGSEDDDGWELDFRNDGTSGTTARGAFENVQRQQQAISLQLKKGDESHARKYVDELVRSQLRSGGASFASKSLCKLAQEAKGFGLHSLQLEWAKRAAELCPDDGWAHGQAADAFMFFNRFDEALRAFDLAEANGQPQFAITGRARILRAQARLDEALAAFKAAEQQLSGDELVFAWLGHAEVLRDMWLLPDSLQVYEETIARFPNSTVARCGRAAVLTDMGRLDDALDAYEETLRSFGDVFVALSGRVQVWKQKGLLENALKECDQILQRFPTEPITYCQRAEILRLSGDFENALTAYADAETQFPYISAAYGGFAEVLKEKHQYVKALEVYDAAIRRFPFDSRLRNGRASVLKLAGRLDLALRAYDETAGLFPYELVTLAGRADLLKETGDFDGAIKLYDQIIGKWPGYYSAKHAKAAILVVRGLYVEADRLLPRDTPQTYDEWIGFHVRGMMLLRQGELEAAITHFTMGSLNVPYARERRYFENALAVAYLRRREYPAAIKLIDRVAGPMGNVIQLHAYAAVGRRGEAQSAYERTQENCPAQLIELRDELAARYHLSATQPHHDETWIFHQECESMLILDAA